MVGHQIGICMCVVDMFSIRWTAPNEDVLYLMRLVQCGYVSMGHFTICLFMCETPLCCQPCAGMGCVEPCNLSHGI